MPDLKTIRTRCLVVDDEPPAREVIKRYIGQMPNLELVAECANAVQAIALLQQEPIDLLFLDIRMPQLSGVDFLRALKNLPKVIFTTAFPEYALDGFELDVADYLLKPIKFERFIKAVYKACPATERPLPAQVAADEPVQKESFVYFRADRKMVKVMLGDILYIESMKDYVRIHTTGTTIITKQSISSVEAMLPEGAFLRTHRSFIVSILHIKDFTPETIGIGNTEIPIGKLFRNEVIKALT